MYKIKKNDSVKVISGNFNGQTGRILKVLLNKNRAIVEGLNKAKKHVRPSEQNQQGGIIEKEMSIHLSNLMLIDKGKPTKISFKVLDNGKKVRINRKNSNVIK